MNQTWTLTDQKRSFVCEGQEGPSEARKAHRDYRVIDPQTIAHKLSQGGLRARLAYGSKTKAHLKSPLTAILEVTDTMVALKPGYDSTCCIYFDHRGKAAVKFTAGPKRVECANMFMCPDLSIHHCSLQADLFLATPCSVVRGVLRRVRDRLERLESLKRTLGGAILPAFVKSKAPRLGKRVFHEFARYRAASGNTQWSALQALTEPSNRRLDEFAGRLLGDPDAYQAMLSGGDMALHLERNWN